MNMESLELFGVLKEGKLQFESQLLGVALVSINEPLNREELVKKLTELELSYFNQWGFTLKAYMKLYALFSELNSTDDSVRANDFSTYDYKAMELRDDLQHCVYLFIVSLKSALDLFVGIADFTMYKTTRVGRDIPDIATYAKPEKKDAAFESVILELISLKESDWVKQIKEIRDNIVHRGYLPNADLGFFKQSRLQFNLEKGQGAYISEAESFDVGSIIDRFLTNLPRYDNAIAACLISLLNIPEADRQAKAIFSIEGGMTVLYHDGISRWS